MKLNINKLGTLKVQNTKFVKFVKGVFSHNCEKFDKLTVPKTPREETPEKDS